MIHPIASKQKEERYMEKKPPILLPDNDLPNAIIVDVEGTLALLKERKPDTPNEAIEFLLHTYHYDAHFDILLVSERSEQYHWQTSSWLAHKYIPFTYLFMRKVGDSRSEVEVKQGIYEHYIKDQYNVSFVLDDNKDAVALWRSLGLTCLQVADGDY